MKVSSVLGMVSLSLLVSCGNSYSKKEDSGGGVTAEQKQFFSVTIKPILTDSCAMVGCHANADFVKTPEAFIATGAIRIKVLNGLMPIPGTPGASAFSENDKTLTLGYPGNAK